MQIGLIFYCSICLFHWPC